VAAMSRIRETGDWNFIALYLFIACDVVLKDAFCCDAGWLDFMRSDQRVDLLTSALSPLIRAQAKRGKCFAGFLQSWFCWDPRSHDLKREKKNNPDLT